MNSDVAVFASRRERLRELLRREGLAAQLVSLSANRYYLSGFELHNPQENESAGMVLVHADGTDVLYTDPRYKDMALRLWPEAGLCIYSGGAAVVMAESIGRLVRGEMGIEAGSVSLAFYEELAANLPPSVTVRRSPGLVEELRRVKSAEEIARMDASCALNHAMMAWLPSILQPGRREADIAWDVEKFFRDRGASELAFATIVGKNANAALPHCIPGEDRLEADGLVLVDAGCRVRDYCSDQTRTFWIGDRPSSRFKETLAAVQEAQRRAIAVIRPGVACKEAFQAAWSYFEELGVAAAFTHGLGHGVGLETHEAPSLSRLSNVVLEPGMIVTVEPGLYDAAWGGVRWEYMVLVTDDGCRVL